MLQIQSAHFHVAAELTNQHLTGLLGGDALHLAVASNHRATICTLDRLLAGDGPSIGSPTYLVA